MKIPALILSLLCGHSLAATIPAPVPVKPARTPGDMVFLHVPTAPAGATISRVASSDEMAYFPLTKRFFETFATMPELADAAGAPGRWAPHLDGGVHPNNPKLHLGYNAATKRRQNEGHEQQVYIDPTFNAIGVSPFSIADSILTITARRTPDDLFEKAWGYPFISGLLSTHQKYAQQYGYFEISSKVPAGSKLLPAFWMLSTSRTWPPEIDIMEAPASYPGQISQGTHSTNVNSTTLGMKTAVPGFDTAFHSYGALWLKEKVVFYIDRVPVSQVATRPDQHQPFYMMVNLAVGGKWPGWLKANDDFPARTMEVDWIVTYTPTSAPCVRDVFDNRGVEICVAR
ncbi:glycoside hydrolase family 16 protein [Massilia atriviolacea]|uniref:Glycoside hydrolase family 16 protein n=1 Tax=Massilia atriviolacea TaxID=2495579 RepID=A0A430HQK9_9BURK|nr:glycoside hydrolase family 16 protein [Massilia atriviolacea]RSZ59805.1 glycoside hydrolase family 16 protein [Massilia atriviolacea]